MCKEKSKEDLEKLKSANLPESVKKQIDDKTKHIDKPVKK
jgi:hypothetical protein